MSKPYEIFMFDLNVNGLTCFSAPKASDKVTK